MFIGLTIGLIGGLAVFLYGMMVMNDNITESAGKKFRSILLSLTKNNLKGFLTGLAITTVNQSSSATTVMEVGFVGAGLMTFYQTIAVTMGAEVGSTVTAQLVAFKITKYALIFVALGFFISLFVKSKQVKGIGNAILGFGLLFLGMDIMSKSLEPLRSFQPFLNMMTKVETPIVGILVGLIFTLIIQSSGATSGIVIAMALSGTITFEQAVPINLGATIGTSITAFLGSLTLNREAKRVAYSHTISQTIGVIIAFVLIQIPFQGTNFWYWFCKWVTKTFFLTTDLSRQIAMAHTLSAVVKCLILFPFIDIYSNLLTKLFPSKEEEKPFGPIYISDTLLDTPGVALQQAKKEILRTGQIVSEMFAKARSCIDKYERNLILCDQVSLIDVKVDKLRHAIVDYLRKIASKNLSEEESQQEIKYLYIINDIENIGDIIDKNIMPIAKKITELDVLFSSEGWYEICNFHDIILKNLNEVLIAFEKDDIVLAEKIAQTKPEIGKYESELKMKHISRLHRGLPESIETSSMHLDLIDQYKRINSHIASIAYAIKGEL
jgi:phosphate:Na+ symporter